MYSFLVLGLIPGTNIQITFQMWLETLAFVLAVISLYMLLKRYGASLSLRLVRSVYAFKATTPDQPEQ